MANSAWDRAKARANPDPNWESKLDALEEVESDLTPWEIDFVESLDNLRGKRLSEKQSETLNRIYERLC